MRSPLITHPAKHFTHFSLRGTQSQFLPYSGPERASQEARVIQYRSNRADRFRVLGTMLMHTWGGDGEGQRCGNCSMTSLQKHQILGHIFNFSADEVDLHLTRCEA